MQAGCGAKIAHFSGGQLLSSVTSIDLLAWRRNPAASCQRSSMVDRYRVRWNALAQGTRLGRRSLAACTITTTAKFFVRIHKTPRKRPARDVSTLEYPNAMKSEGCEPRASCVAAGRR